MQEPVLVLNATFEPINVTAVRRAMVLMIKGVAQAEEINHTQVHSASRSLEVPSVIRLLAYRHIPQQTRALSRKNILLRDRNTCQFCRRILPASELTLDHVVPRSRGGRSSWENLVACCYQCNNRKGDRTPEEAGLALARRPRPFTLAHLPAVDAPDRQQRRKVAQVFILLRFESLQGFPAVRREIKNSLFI